LDTFILSIIAIPVASIGSSPSASEQINTTAETAKLVASDAAEDDYFGRSVAVGGDLVVVGAYGVDDAGSNSGSAYVFETTDGGASWNETAKLVASDAASGDIFGHSVAISGDLVVVGASRNDDAGLSSGSAYVFETTNGGASWNETAKLVASDAAASDYFGYSVAVGGDLVVVGAYGVDDAGSVSGSAYVFETTDGGASWNETAKLVASDAAEYDYFGHSVAVSGDLVVAGSYADSAYVLRPPLGKPSDAPTGKPSDAPSATPSDAPTATPSDAPSAKPSDAPSAKPSASPTTAPTNLSLDAGEIGEGEGAFTEVAERGCSKHTKKRKCNRKAKCAWVGGSHKCLADCDHYHGKEAKCAKKGHCRYKRGRCVSKKACAYKISHGKCKKASKCRVTKFKGAEKFDAHGQKMWLCEHREKAN
jgi:hypothetical protein